MKKLVLFLILTLAFILRFYRLGDYPALNADEAAIGYNAYSLLETGKDEHGNPWPIHFQSFNDYKPGFYVYLVMPFVKIFGLSEWAVRVPNAMLGVLTVYLVYLLVLELFPKRNHQSLIIYDRSLAYIAAAMLAISPWHIHFSRGAWEVNTSTFFMTAGVLFFLNGLRSQKNLILTSLFFILSLYTYHASRIVVPLMVVGLIGIYFQEFRKNIKYFFVCGFTAFILLLPLAKDMLRPAISSRAAGVGLFADTGPLNRINEQRGEHENYNSLTTKVLHNRLVNYSLNFMSNWAAHFHGLFLFMSGDDIQRNKVPETGQMYMTDFVLVVVGFIWMFKNLKIGHPERPKGVEGSKSVRLIIHWLLIAPVAAALTFQSPHALRAESMVIPLIIVSAIGFTWLVNWFLTFKNYNFKFLLVLILGVFEFLSFSRYLHMYYVHMSKEYPYSSQYGVKELVKYVSENESKYQNILVTTKYDQPYILFLFYKNYDPMAFQNNHELTRRDQFGFSTVPGFGKYVFKNIDLGSDKIDYPGSLMAGTEEEIPDGENIKAKINGSNGHEYFRMIEN